MQFSVAGLVSVLTDFSSNIAELKQPKLDCRLNLNGIQPGISNPSSVFSYIVYSVLFRGTAWTIYLFTVQDITEVIFNVM